tara:strand:+ start:271 stop:447 length:177 start_codon:yes stop_codon:yes gene_type:complete
MSKLWVDLKYILTRNGESVSEREIKNTVKAGPKNRKSTNALIAGNGGRTCPKNKRNDN